MDHAPVKKEEARVFPAHILENRIQDCRDHCLHTAECAKKEAMPAGLGATAFLAGLLHDCGKFTTEFENYIEKAVKGEQVRKGSVIHSFAGVFYMLTRYHQNCQTDLFEKLTAEMIAAAIGSHHGLFDCVNSQGDNGFTYRLKKQPGYEEEAIGNLLSGPPPPGGGRASAACAGGPGPPPAPPGAAGGRPPDTAAPPPARSPPRPPARPAPPPAPAG